MTPKPERKIPPQKPVVPPPPDRDSNRRVKWNPTLNSWVSASDYTAELHTEGRTFPPHHCANPHESP